MSFEVKKESLKTDLPAGIHPLVVSDIRKHMIDGKVAEYNNGPGMILQLASVNNKIHEELYWINSPSYSRFRKILIQLGLNPNEKLTKKDAIGKRIWGFIAELHYIDGEGQVAEEFDLRLFDTGAFISGDKPAHRDDPERHNGRITGDFYKCIQIEGMFGEDPFAKEAKHEEIVTKPVQNPVSDNMPPPPAF